MEKYIREKIFFPISLVLYLDPASPWGPIVLGLYPRHISHYTDYIRSLIGECVSFLLFQNTEKI